MVFVAFLVPLGIYLVVLGLVNRRGQPMLVPGVWDRVGMLFGVSGFVVAGGPAILTALNDRWRMWWLLADPGAPRPPIATYLSWWVLACAAYFVVVVAGVAWMLMRARAWTCIYSIEGAAAAAALDAALEELGLRPTRTGGVYDFDGAARLELEPFDLLTTTTLRWSPGDSLLRPRVEVALTRHLEAAEAPDRDTGLWLSCAGLVAMSGALLIIITLILRSSQSI